MSNAALSRARSAEDARLGATFGRAFLLLGGGVALGCSWYSL
jgi:hypothetical protein